MAKVEIEVPDGKIANVIKDGDKVVVTFKEISILDRLKDFHTVFIYLSELASNNVKWAIDILDEYNNTKSGSYSEKLIIYRMVVAALTNNEKNHLVSGDRYIPYVDFCDPGKEKNCDGKTIVGHIESEGRKFTVVGGSTNNSSNAGLGCFNSYNSVSNSYMNVGFRSVSSRKIAEHISKYFGRLVFDIMYGAANCDYKWVD